MGQRIINTCDGCNKDISQQEMENARSLGFGTVRALLCSLACAVKWLTTRWDKPDAAGIAS